MKHLFINDDEYTFMIYFQPKQKTKLIELIYETEKDYWASDYENSDWGLLMTIYFKLKEKGFKIKEITKEINQSIDVYNDLCEDTIRYRGVEVRQNPLGFNFRIGNTTNSVFSLEQAIKTIDREVV